MKKAQTIIEILTTYGWTILVLLIFIALLYYYNVFEPSRMIPESCNFGPDTSCSTLKFQQKDPTSETSTLLLIFSNGLGRDIAFTDNSATVTTYSVGKIGTGSYKGTCRPTRNAVKQGDQFLCQFDITDTEAIPSFGKNYRFTVQIQYLNCENDPCYGATGGCGGGSLRTFYGEAIARYSPYTNFEFCGNGFCNVSAGESASNCSMDCKMAGSTPIINIILPVNYIAGTPPPAGYYTKLNVTLNFTSVPPISSAGYRVNGGRCVTITGNTSIPGPMPDSIHSLILYGDWNSSVAVVFRYCLGDINKDFVRDILDNVLLSGRYACNCTSGCLGSAPWDAAADAADLNGDCVVDDNDLNILRSVIGKLC